MTPARVKAEYFARSPDQLYPNDIQCARETLEQLSALAVQGLFRLRHGGLEIGGMLFGHREPRLVRVEAFRELECEHAFGPAFRLSDADWDRFAALARLPETDPDLEGMAPVGWYVSHTRTGLSLTEIDQQVFQRCLPDSSAIALVLKPDQFLPTRAAWFANCQTGAIAELTLRVQMA